MPPRLRSVRSEQRGSSEQKRRSASRVNSLRNPSIFSRNGQIQINGGNFSVSGRDSYAYLAIQAELGLALRAIPNFRKIHQDTLAKATQGTGMWLLKSEKFRIWLEPNGDLKIILGFGIPGAGKTILAAIIIDYLEALAKETHTLCVAYVYIRFSNREQITVKSILQILVKQVVERHPNCLALVEKAYARHLREGTQPTEGELLQLLRRLSEKMTATFYILDAIDEAPDKIRIDLVKKLASLDVRLFITSRPLQAVEAKLPEAHTVSIVARDQDLDLLIAEKFDGATGLLQHCDANLREQIVTTVKSKCGGMFLHASLQLDALQQCSTPHDIMETLQEFPEQIEDVYKQTWNRIVESEPHQGALPKTALAWVLNAQRSMTIDELRHALATSPSTYNFESSRLMPEPAFMAIFRGLIVVDKRSTFVRLVHKTARRTIETLLSECFPYPHVHLSAVCITHLTNCGFQNTSITSQDGLEQALQADPLLAYAHVSWGYHAQHSLELQSAAARVTGFVAGCTSFPVLVNNISGFDLLGPLHLVSISNLPVQFTGLNSIDDPNIPTPTGGHRPLGLASWRGNRNILESLLPLPTTLVNAVDNDGVSALMWAASTGNIDFIDLLLEHPDIDVNLVDVEGWSSLLKAAANGREPVVRRLLAHPDVEANLTSASPGGFALTWAAGKGHTGIVELFLARPEISVNSVDSEGRSALIWAASNGHDATVEFLLSCPDIDVNLIDSEGCSALMKAEANDRKTVVKRLLAYPGIDRRSHIGNVTVALCASPTAEDVSPVANCVEEFASGSDDDVDEVYEDARDYF